jgi:hemerythrin-like domain-containing protein
MTTDHETIKQWASERDGKPARVEGTEQAGPGVLQIEFQEDGSPDDLQRIQWPTFFKKFDEEQLALLYQDRTRHGQVSRFCKLVYAPMGLLRELHEQHESIRSILEDMASTTSRAEKTRPRLVEKLEQQLVPHMKAEEKVFYKQMKQAADEDQAPHVLEGYEEHRLTRKALKRLKKADVDDPKWEARCKVLKELIEHHIEEEESELFDLARNLLEAEGLEEIQEPYEARFDKAKEKLS